jgi:hypothetical protein
MHASTPPHRHPYHPLPPTHNPLPLSLDPHQVDEAADGGGLGEECTHAPMPLCAHAAQYTRTPFLKVDMKTVIK